MNITLDRNDGTITLQEGVHGVVFDGRRYDTGDKLSYLKAVIQFATERDDIGDDLREWISEQEF